MGTGTTMPSQQPSSRLSSTPSSRQLHLLHLVSPALPIGGFAYSQGLEYAIDAGWLNTPEALHDWLGGLLDEGLAHLELPLLQRFAVAYAENDSTQVEHWEHWLAANRETKELLFEDQQMGMALRRLLVSLEVVSGDERLPAAPSYCSQFALAARHFDVPTEAMLNGFAWSWLENQISVACKTVPLGQTAAQQLLMRLLPAIDRAVHKALLLEDKQLGATLPGFALASALHETQYSRLFRS
jgi:urease accessory protein